MRHLYAIIATLTCTLGGFILGWTSNGSKVEPHKNQAMIVERMLNLDNPICEELTTGWGFTPDTAICQAATKTGETRVPTQIVWCAAGLSEPACKTVYDLRKKP